MKLLLDTCAILFSTLAPDKLSQKAKGALQAKDTEVFVSAISVGEIACAYGKKIHLDRHWKQWFRDCCETQNWQIIPIDLNIMEEAYSLPENFHQDPADRILVATSRTHKIPIVTSDRLIQSYPHVSVFW